jgi:uncharacterized protein DUF3891
MIIREAVGGDAGGEAIVVGQTDHSRFVGQLAAHWGNDEVARPDPWESVVRAAIYHDYGWITYETNPLIDEETGKPYRFLELPLEERQLESYQWCIDWMAATDVYAALIISRHRTGLWKGRYGSIDHPQGKYDLHKLDRRIIELIERNEAWQEKTMKSLGERARAAFPTNYRMLQVWDLLGLYFCCQEPYADYIDPVPTGFGGKGRRMTMQPQGERKVLFDPYPFDEPELRVQLSCKRLTSRKYSSVAEFREAYFKAPNDLLEYQLTSKH